MDRIRAMQAYVRLVEKSSFSAVAKELHVKQSTVSKWLKALEEELGAQLIERTTRRQRVTDAGQRFYERALVILELYEEASQEAASTETALRGRLRVSVPAVFGRRHVLPAVPPFLEAHPEVELELVFSDRYVDLVEEGVDVAVRVGRPVDSSFRATLLAEAGRRLVASPAYLDLHGRPETPKDLERHRCLVHRLSVGDAWDIQRGNTRHRVRVRGRFAANQSEALCAMAEAGFGVAMLADWLVEGAVASGGLEVLLPDCTLPPAPVRAVFPPGRRMTRRTRAWVDHVRDAMCLVR